MSYKSLCLTPKTAQRAIKDIIEHSDEDPHKATTCIHIDNLEFTDVDLSGLKIPQVMFTNCHFTNCSFGCSRFGEGSSFKHCYLEKCSFFATNLFGCFLCYTIFNDCSFCKTRVDGIYLTCAYFNKCNVDEMKADRDVLEHFFSNLERIETEHRLLEGRIDNDRIWGHYEKEA